MFVCGAEAGFHFAPRLHFDADFSNATQVVLIWFPAASDALWNPLDKRYGCSAGRLRPLLPRRPQSAGYCYSAAVGPSAATRQQSAGRAFICAQRRPLRQTAGRCSPARLGRRGDADSRLCRGVGVVGGDPGSAGVLAADPDGGDVYSCIWMMAALLSGGGAAAAL